MNDLLDVDKAKTVGGNFAVSLPLGGGKGSSSTLNKTGGPAHGTPSNAPAGNTSTDAASNVAKKGAPFNTLTVGGVYHGHTTERTSHATLGLGDIVIGGETLTDDNQNRLISTTTGSTLNRDLNHAQEITKDQDIGGLNASVTVDGRWLSDTGRKEMVQQVKDAGKNSQIVAQGLEKDVQRISTDIAPEPIANGLKTADLATLGLLPFDSADNGGLLAQLPSILSGEDIKQKRYTVIAKDSDYAKAHPELFMPASELPGYSDLAKEGKSNLDNKLVSRDPVVINKDTATFQNFTNGMMNTLAEAAVNGGEQTKSDIFTLNYNPRHGFLADILEIGTDKVGVAVTETWKPVSAYTGINLGFSSGVAQGTGDFMQQVMQARGEAGANFAAHSQGNILTQAGLLGQQLQGLALTHKEVGLDGEEIKVFNFSVSSYGSPVNNADMSDLLFKKGMLYSTSVAKDGDFVAKFLGGNTGTYNANDPAHANIKATTMPFLSQERWTEGGNPFKLLGDKYEKKNEQGEVTNKDKISAHSSYECVGICDDKAPWEEK